MRVSTIVSSLTVLVMVAASLGVAMGNASASEGSKDSYGYKYTDSKAPAPSVAFNWVEINATGTDTGLTGTFDEAGPLSIGFTFNFYGSTYSNFYVNTNGFISFNGGASYEWSNDAIPYWPSPDNFIAPYWDYGENYDGTIYYETKGVSPNQQLIVEWENVSTIWTGSLLTYEVILNETGDIWFQYLDVGTDYGQDASVGIEDSTGDVGTQYSYETSSLSDNLAIRFSTGAVMITPSQTGVGKLGTDVSYALTVKNWQTVADSFDITYASSQGWTVYLYDSLANPLVDSDGDTVPDTGTVAAGSTVSIEVRVSIPASPIGFQDITTVTATSFLNSAAFDSCIVTTDVAGAWFTPPHEDVGLDQNGIGYFEVLSVNASVDVRVADWYYIEGYLYTASEAYISYDSGYASLTPGSGTLNLRFFGYQISESGVDGPYHVHMTLYDGSYDVQDTDVHYTAAYARTEFMTRPGVLGTTHGDGVLDTDGDGLFDSLFINATVMASYDWSFRVDVYLDDSSYSYMTYAQNYTSLTAGTRVVSTEFAAWDIVELGQDGFFYAAIYLYALIDGAWIYIDSDSHTTGDYTLSQFERRPIFFSSPINDYANDTDSDGSYNFLEISATVDVAIEGDYSIKGILRADSWQPVIDTVIVNTHLTVGLHTIDLYFPGWPIYENSDSDDMDVTLEAWSGSILVDTELYTTPTYYYYWDFETAPGWFEPPYNDYGLDTNSDTLFDYLVCEIPVTVETAGYYEVEATIEAIWDIETVSTTAYLDVGTTTVEIRFTGWLIWNEGYDGPYDVYLYLYDSGNRELDNDWFNTAAYLYTDFPGIPAAFGSPHEAYVEDTDSDGYYDGLFVNATVVVASAGLFLVQGILYDPGWTQIVGAGKWANLGSGTHVVRIAFPAWMININGDDGIFHVELYLYDAGRNYLDYDSLSTSSYMNETFELTVPTINSVWADTAPTMDGTMSPGEWASATAVDLTGADTRNTVSGTLLIMNDATNLYIAYDAYGDTHEDSNDASTIAFDTGNDGVRTDGHEDSFMLSGWSPSDGQHFVFSSAFSSWTSHCYPFDTVAAEHATLAGNAGFGPSDGHAIDHRTYEYSIPLALLDIAPGDVIGFLGRNWGNNGVYDSSNGTSSSWPVLFPSSPSMTQYGDLHLAEESIAIPPPVTTASASGTSGTAGWYKSQVGVTLTATGGSGGLDYTLYRLDGGSWTTYSAVIQITAQGTHTLEFRSVDMAAQTESIKTLTVKIDSVMPVTTSTVSGTSLWLNASDATSGVSTIMYSIDNGTWKAYSVVVNVSVEGVGTHVIDYYTTDAAGNREPTQSVTIEIKDTTADSDALGGAFIWIGLIAAAAIAALVVLLLVMKRKKGQQPAQMGPAQGIMVPPEQVPPPPQA